MFDSIIVCIQPAGVIMKYLLIGLTFFIYLFVSLPAVATEPVVICDDGEEWPPFTYFERENGVKTQKVIGYSIDVIQRIFKKHGITYKASLIPWSRCQAMVEKGIGYNMALNASFNSTREAKFFLTVPYYQTRPYYFYSKKMHPEGLDVKTNSDFKKYKVCGLIGYNYEFYGVSKNQVSQSAVDFPSLIKQLHSRQCDLFFEQLEIMAGFTAIYKDYLSQNIGYKQAPGVPPTNFHMLISKKMPGAEQFLQMMNEEISSMKQSGLLVDVFSQYVKN